MLNGMTRAKLIQGWFAAVALVIAAVFAFGTTVTLGTALILVALSLVPPAIVMMLWPGVQAPTAADVIRGTDRRG